MCTLILAWQLFEGAPVVAAANRDEMLDRPSSPPTVSGGTPRVFAPRDERAGGTWIGYNDRGVFVAITNRWAGPGLAGERSRGLLVRDALERATAREARELVRAEVDAREYGPFHLLVADARTAALIEWDGTRAVHGLAPGLYVVRNVGWTAAYRPSLDGKRGAESTFTPAGPEPGAGERQRASLRRTRDALVPDGNDESGDERGPDGADEPAGPDSDPDPDPSPDPATAWTGRAKRVLSDHEFDLCVHRDDEFGTRSSSVVVLGADGAGRFEYTDGPPCDAAYRSLDAPSVAFETP